MERKIGGKIPISYLIREDTMQVGSQETRKSVNLLIWPFLLDSSAGKESACNAGDLSSIPGLGRSAGEGKGYPLQYSGLENSMDCIVYRVAETGTRLNDFHSLTHSLISVNQLVPRTCAPCWSSEPVQPKVQLQLEQCPPFNAWPLLVQTNCHTPLILGEKEKKNKNFEEHLCEGLPLR